MLRLLAALFLVVFLPTPANGDGSPYMDPQVLSFEQIAAVPQKDLGASLQAATASLGYLYKTIPLLDFSFAARDDVQMLWFDKAKAFWKKYEDEVRSFFRATLVSQFLMGNAEDQEFIQSCYDRVKKNGKPPTFRGEGAKSKLKFLDTSIYEFSVIAFAEDPTLVFKKQFSDIFSEDLTKLANVTLSSDYQEKLQKQRRKLQAQMRSAQIASQLLYHRVLASKDADKILKATSIGICNILYGS